MALRQKRPGVGQTSGGGGQKPLLSFINAFNQYDPGVAITPGMENQGPQQDGSVIPETPPVLTLNKPNWGQRFLDPSAQSTYNAIKNNFELGNYQASVDMRDRLRAIAEAGVNQQTLEEKRSANDRALAEKKFQQDQTIEEAKHANALEADRAKGYQTRMNAEREAANKAGYRDPDAWGATVQPMSISRDTLAKRGFDAVLGLGDSEYNQAERTRFLGEAEKQAVLNDDVRAQTRMRPILQLGPNSGGVDVNSGQTWLNSAPQENEFAKPNGGISTSVAPVNAEGFVKKPGGVNAEFKETMLQQQQPQIKAPITQAPKADDWYKNYVENFGKTPPLMPYRNDGGMTPAAPATQPNEAAIMEGLDNLIKRQIRQPLLNPYNFPPSY